MFSPSERPLFTLTFEGVDSAFHVLEFECEEAINTPFIARLKLVSDNVGVNLERCLHKPATLTFGTHGEKIHGLVHLFAQGECRGRFSHYNLELVPALTYLKHRTNQRIFQQLSTPQIIAKVLQDNGILSNAFTIIPSSALYPVRDYCTQYDETDLDLINRLCEEEGIHYHFQHGADSCHLYFGDNNSAFPLPKYPTLYKHNTVGLVPEEPVINHFTLRLEARTTRVTRRDYDPLQARFKVESSYKGPHTEKPATVDFEDYDYPAGFTAHEQRRGQQLSIRAFERHRTDYHLATGTSDQPTLRAGHYLEMTDHQRPEWNGRWLVTSIKHQGFQPQVLEETLTQPQEKQGYSNTFKAIPAQVNFRPALVTPKPRILGSQTAKVTGPANEEVHVDHLGRVKAQLHWDREGNNDEHSSCWLRVSTTWAGDRYGSIAIPRIGMEVLVTYLEGDPDQPIISGCLYNSSNQTPYPLPANKTRSLFKSLSSLAGGGANEVRIEDRKDQEEIYLHAERDWQQMIKHDQLIRVDNERHDIVGGNSYTELKAEEHHTTHGSRHVQLKASDHLDVADSVHLTAGNAILIESGSDIHYKASRKLVIDAGAELTLKVGGNFIKLDASGTWLKGSQIGLNAGGGLATVPKVDVLKALLPLGAVSTDPGKKPPFNVGVVMMRDYAERREKGNKFCPICEECGRTETFTRENDDILAEPEWPEGQVDYKLVGDIEDDDEMDFKWLTVPNGQLTFDVEGNDYESPTHPQHVWFSRKVHWPGGASGITIGRGYDLGQRPNPGADLAAAGIGEPLFSS